MTETLSNKINISLMSREELNEANDRVSKLEALLAQMKIAKKADVETINSLREIESELKARNISLDDQTQAQKIKLSS